MRSKEDTDNSRRVFQSASASGRYKYDMMPRCPDCGIHMKYIYGEMFECPVCHRQEQTEFGKVRSYLEEHGPQPAIVISNETGVPVNVIDNFLRQGRIEIPDGSPVYQVPVLWRRYPLRKILSGLHGKNDKRTWESHADVRSW